MKILELFSGTGSFSKVAKARGHEVFTIDNDPQFKPDLCKDILEVTKEDIPFQPDIIWSSPPCQKFSVMTIYRNWEKLEDGTYKPKNEETIKHIEIHKKGLQLIRELKPKFFFIENPRAMLRKQDFIKSIPRKTITYCQYGSLFQKATDIFTNCESWKPKPMCSPKSPCHVRAPRGSRYGIQGGMSGFRKNRPNQKHPDIFMLKKYRRDSLHPADMGDSVGWNATVKRGIVPEKLCLEILQSCEQLIATPSDSPSASANAEDLICVKEKKQSLLFFPKFFATQKTFLNANIKLNLINTEIRK